MARRSSSVADMISAFNHTYNISRRVQQDRAVAEVADAKPVESEGFTAEQGEQIAKAAQQDPMMGYDEARKAYVFTPQVPEGQMGPMPQQVISQQGVTDFMGERHAGKMSADQVSAARDRAMANAIGKFDPVEGARLRREAGQAERDDWRFGREKKKATDEDAEQRAIQDAYAGTVYAQRMKEYAPKAAAYLRTQATQEAQWKTGTQPAAIGLPAQQPERFAYSIADSLADQGRILDAKSRFGKADPAELMKYAQAVQQVNDEGYVRALRAAQAGAPLESVAQQFRQGGAVKFDPSMVVKDEMVKNADGVASRVLTVRDPATGRTQTIDALAELDGLGKAEEFHNRFFKHANVQHQGAQLAEATRHNRAGEVRADRALSIQAANANVSNQVHMEQLSRLREDNKDRAGLRAVREELASVIESGDKDREAALRKQLALYATGVKSGTTGMAPEERRAMFYLSSGLAKTEADAARMAHEKVQSSAKDDYMALMKPNSMGMQPSPEQIEPVMAAMHGADWKAKLSGAGGQALPRITNAADVERLPAGSSFIAPDGSVRMKPAAPTPVATSRPAARQQAPGAMSAAASVPSRSDAVLMAQQGTDLDSARDELRAAREDVRGIGLRQRKADPEAFSRALARVQSAEEGQKAAEREWGKYISQQGLGPALSRGPGM